VATESRYPTAQENLSGFGTAHQKRLTPIRRKKQAIWNPGQDVSTPIRNFECRAWHLYHRQWMVIMDSFRRFILPGFFRIGVNGRRYFGRKSVTTLKVNYRPFEDLMVRVPHHDPEHGGSIFLTTLSLSMGRRVRAVSPSNRFMAPTDLAPHLIPSGDDFLNRLMSDRG